VLSTVGGKAELLSALFSRNLTRCRRRLKKGVQLDIADVGYSRLSIYDQRAEGIDEKIETTFNERALP
jgi:hypothetical protein